MLRTRPPQHPVTKIIDSTDASHGRVTLMSAPLIQQTIYQI